jgi:hypothetical protein
MEHKGSGPFAFEKISIYAAMHRYGEDEKLEHDT